MRDFIEDCIFAFMVALLCAVILGTCSNSQAYELEIYDSRELPWMTEIVLVNDCDYKHRLLIPIEDYEKKQDMIGNWVLAMMKVCSKKEAEQLRKVLETDNIK